MKYRVLGKTGWKLSVLGFGAGPLGGAFGDVKEKDAVRAVHTAIDLGINYVDASPQDGSVRCETVLGKALKDIPREKFYIASQVGRYGPEDKDIDFSAARVTRSVDESLKRLRIAHIDLVQCYDAEFGTISQLAEETLPALMKLKRQGKVRHVGVTGHRLKFLKRLLDNASVDTVQSYCHYCLNDTTFVQLFVFLKARGTGIINGAPFGMGLLTEKGPPKWHPAPAAIRDTCAKAVAYCKKRKVSLPALALQFATSHRDITTTVVGTSSVKKVKENVGCLEEPLDQEVLAEVQEILRPIQNVSWPSGRKENN